MLVYHLTLHTLSEFLFSLENDVMATLKRCGKFLLLIFILKCLSKFNLIPINCHLLKKTSIKLLIHMVTFTDIPVSCNSFND